MGPYTTLTLEQHEGVATITLSRPAAAHALDLQMAADLARAARACESDARVRAVVITASGRFFCAGGDLRHLSGLGDEARAGSKLMADTLHAAVSTFARMNSPVVMAINGICAGAGFSLAMSGDLTLASEAASFTMGYGAVGLSPDGSSTYFLPRLVGLRRAQELMLTSRTLSAAEALDWGLVNRVVPPDALIAEALQWARRLAAGAVQANASVKRLLHVSFGNGLETQMELEGRQIAECIGSPDGQEGMRAFLEKRPARFR